MPLTSYPPPSPRDNHEPMLHKEKRDGVCAVFITISAVIGGLVLCAVIAVVLL